MKSRTINNEEGEPGKNKKASHHILAISHLKA